jgi:hypothetical protein
MTDRGRIYIIHGKPDEIESHPSGGQYERPMSEGGGSSNAFPYEVWRYRYIEGIGNDVMLEFVDPTLSGQYRLALLPEEKDALLYMPGGGLTLAEQMGLAGKEERPFFSGGRREDYPLMYSTQKDNPFIRYETYSQVQAPTPIKYTDLKQLVEVNIEFDSIPFATRQDYFKLNEEQVLVSLSLQVENKNLTFKSEGDNHVAKVAVYGIITSITNRLIDEFDDDVIAMYQPEVLQAGLKQKSIFQKVFVLERKLRYKLNLVIKDLNSSKIGVIQTAIVPPRFDPEKLVSSSLVLSSAMRILELTPTSEEMFVIGDVKVRPNLDKSFSTDQLLGVYLQLYNVAIDQSSLEPSLHVVYRILKNGDVMRETVDETGETVQFFSGRRVVLVNNLGLEDLEKGKYQLRLEIQDRLSDQKLTLDDDFQVVERQMIALNQ